MQNQKDIIFFIRTVMKEHDKYWEDKQALMKKLHNVYNNEFWTNMDTDDGMLRIETSDAYSIIESLVASLFSRSPAIEIAKDDALNGSPELSKAVVNRFLYNQRRAFEDASRISLIYPAAYFKLAPRNSDSILDKVSIRPVLPWEVIIDRDSSSWEDQRFIGHTYYLTVYDAKERFGHKKYNGVCKEDYFTGPTDKAINKSELPEMYLYIKVVELYDLLNDKLYFWSPNYSNGDKLLDNEIIPVRTYDDLPLAPIAPLYYSRVPNSPLEGTSTLSRHYDQIYEKNILRTYYANAVRRDSRQFIYKEGAFDEEQLAKITAGIDGAMIGVDEESLDGLIREVPVTPISSNFDRYLNYIEQDINRGTIMAPFTRGEATNATATEITALAQYTASEIGKLARDRDESIEHVANIYLRILSFMAEEGEKTTIVVDGVAKIITPESLDAKFKIAALDQGSQPLSDAIKKQNLVQLLPILTQLGVPLDKIKEEVIRQWDLPDSFLEVPEQQEKIGPNSIPGQGEIQATQPETPGPEDLARTLISRNMG